MDFLGILGIAVGLAMDAFAVSLGAGAADRQMRGRAQFRLSFHFGLFQFLMPIAGWLAGSTLVHYVAAIDHWIALGLLALVGGRMIRAGFDRETQAWRGDPTRGWTLVMLSVATSIDALAVGLTLAMLGTLIWYPSAVIGVTTAALSFAGIRLGARLGRAFGKRMEIAGGLLLIGIGLRIFVAHHWR